MRNGDPTAKRVVARLTHTLGKWRLIPQGVKHWVNNSAEMGLVLGPYIYKVQRKMELC